MAGNRLSTNGRTWTYYVGKHSSGTGNKQWLHIKTKNNNITLWVLEQTPQKITSRDETELLSKKGYWINCGISYYDKVITFSCCIRTYQKEIGIKTKNCERQIMR